MLTEDYIREVHSQTLCVMYGWCRATRPDVLAAVWQRAARIVLEKTREQDDDLADPDDIGMVRRLADETQKAAARFVEAPTWYRSLIGPIVDALPPRTYRLTVPEPDADGVPALSLALADFIREIDPAGADAWLNGERNRATERLRQLEMFRDEPWKPGVPMPGWAYMVEGYDEQGQYVNRRHLPPETPPATRALARAVWVRVRKEIESERERAERTKAPAQIAQLALVWARTDARVQVLDAGEVQARGRRTGLVAAPAVDLDALRTMTRDLHTLPARRTVYWFARAAWLAYVDGGETRGDGWRARAQHDGSVHVRIEGGHERLAELVGETTKKARRVPFETMVALSRLHLAVDGGVLHEAGALVALARATRGSRAGPGLVEVTLSRWWAVGVVHEIPAGSRRLVPVLNVPPMDGIAEVHRPAVAGMEAGALVYLAQHSDELAEHDAVQLDWREIGREAGVSDEVATAAAALWQNRGRWHSSVRGWRLGDADNETCQAHELLVEGGRRRLRGRERGRASADRKRKGPTKHR